MAAARTPLEIFAQMPARVFPYASLNTRLDMIDYWNAGLSSPSENIFGGKTRIVNVSDCSAQILIGTGTLVLAVLPNEGDSVVAVIETVKSPTPNSTLSFYRLADWTRIPVGLPTLKDFMTPEAKNAKLLASDYPDMTFSTVDFDSNNGKFIFRDRTVEHYTPSDGSPLPFASLPYISPVVERIYKKGKLVPSPK